MRKILVRICAIFIVMATFSVIAYAETVGVFFNSAADQTKFAAADIKTALESKGYTVEMWNLSQLNSTYANKKVVIALVTDSVVNRMLTSDGVTIPAGIGEQAYALRTTTQEQTSYWVLGGDNNGAMYGGLQIAENIKFKSFSGTYSTQESPAILKRGIKLNYPLDSRSPTYGKHDSGTFEGISYKNAIANIWDMNYWTEWFDEMARNRYNVVSLWLCHPFTSLVKMDEYPDVAIKDVTGFDGFTKTMTIDQKIVFWQQVMAYAHARGFEFYFFNWNLFTYGATDKYGITGKVDNPATVTYMYKSMKKLLETYPHLDGFGVTAGEKMTGDRAVNEKFLWDTYGKAMYDYALLNPTRKLQFIHRLHWTTTAELNVVFKPLLSLPNVNFSVSFKYSQAHMYACPTPTWWDGNDETDLNSKGMKTWFTVRNDDFYYHNWGDPTFVRAYINGMPGKTSYLNGFYMGSDGYCPTRSFFSKDSITQGILDVKRQWYMYMLMGRLSYNPNTSDDVFKNYMALKYPEISSNQMFDAWKKASGGIPKVSELITGNLNLDFHWWPEGCHFGRSSTSTSFVTIDKFNSSNVSPGSLLCNFASSAANSCNGKKSTYQVANEIEADALAALQLVETTNINPNTEFGVSVNNIKAMSYLTIYYAYKIRAATDKKANKLVEVTKNLGQAYCWWMRYSNLMDKMYYGMTMQRLDDFPNWHHQDANVLKEYTDHGGAGIPSCDGITNQLFLSVNDLNGGTVKGEGTFKFGENVTVAATSMAGYTFSGWMENSAVVSKDSVYTFAITYDRLLVASFRSKLACDVPWSNPGFSVNKTTVNKTFGPIDISCIANGVTISMNVEGAKTDNLDYCKVYYKIDGGAEKPIAELIGAFAQKTVSVAAIQGKTLEIIIKSATTYNDEFYYISNINVTGVITSAKKLAADYDINIYPNPATKILYISLPNDQKNRKIKIINALGQVVYATQTKNSMLELNVKQLNLKGMIFVQVRTDKKGSNHKVIVQ